MKILKTIQQEIQVTDRIICDLCGGNAASEKNEIKIKHVIIETQSCEGGNGKELDLDICPVCMSEKVVPMLRVFGLKVDYKEYDW